MSLIKLGENGGRPAANYVYCKADLEQKKNHHIEGTDITLYIETKFNENLRERNPNYAEVVYIPEEDYFCGYEKYRKYRQDLKPGDQICVQHFQLVDHSGESLAELEDFNGEQLFRVDLKEVYFKIVDGEPVMLSNFLLCERPEAKTVTDGGIIIPEVAQDGYNRVAKRAIVRYVSDQIRAEINPGDEILFTEFADYEVEFNGKKYLKIASDEVLGVFTTES